jgi:hypothetical protein
VIIGLILVVVFSLLSAVFGIIPDYTMFAPEYQGTTGGGATMLAQMLAALNLFAPVTLLFICAFALLGFKAFVAGAHLVVFVWDKLPFKSS